MAVTNWLKTVQISYVSVGEKSETIFTGIKSRYWQHCFPFWRPQGRLLPCLYSFQTSSTFLGFWVPFSFFKARNTPFHSDHSFTVTSQSSDSLPLPPFSIFKETCDQIEPTEIIQVNLPISKSLIQSHQQNPFCHVKEHIHRFWGLGCGHLQGPLFCLQHSPIIIVRKTVETQQWGNEVVLILLLIMYH